MKNVIKIDDDILEKLSKIQTSFNKATQYYGELHYQLQVLTREIKRMDDEFINIETSRTDWLTDIQTKYGPGVLNIETGEYEKSE